MRIPRNILTTLGALNVVVAMAQCPQLYDYYGTPSDTPAWYSCSGTNFTLVVATPQAVGSFTIDWGDGSPIHVGASLAPPQTVNHVYPAAVATYTVTFTESASGCVVVGTLTMEQSTSASIQIPVGGLTQVCAPHAVEFINSSTNVSPNTVFTWDFGDGSPLLTFDHTNWGQTISHMYEQGTVDCETTVRLTAENTCNTLQGGPSFATFNPIRIWDLDDAAIAASATLLCWPDNEVTFLNTTERNCLAQGNIFQRYEYWNFGDYWGAGQDSIIDWSPWPPTFPRTIAYPGIGTYEVMLLDSNYCGIDTAYIQISIVPPPTVSLLADPTTICAGETVNFFQSTNGGANYFEWDFGTGGGFQMTASGNQSYTYDTPGTYVASYAASIQGATQGCADTASVTITVLPRPTAAFTLDQDAACDSIVVAITDASIDAISYAWDFGDGTTSTDPLPPPHAYLAPGTYPIQLTVTNALGCDHEVVHPVNVYAPPSVAIQVQNLCLGEVAQFIPVINTDPGNPVTAWAWGLGDGTTSDLESPMHEYASPGPYVVSLSVTTPYCGSSGIQWINVQAPPVAVMQPDASIGCSPLGISFDNSSTGAASYTWDFGDGATSTEFEPDHTYINVGTTDLVHSVQLVAISPFGCADTTNTTITVAPGVVAAFQHDAVPGCAPLQVNFTNNSSGAGSYLWDFGDGTTSNAVSPAHTFVNNSLFLQISTVTLTATSPAGCSATVSQQVLVYPTPSFNFTTQPSSGCSPLTVTFPTLVGAVAYEWDLGDGSVASGPAPVHTYVNTTTSDVSYTITLVGTNAFGCTDTTTSTVTVFPNPTASIDASVVSGCHPVTAQLANQSTGADQFVWTYGDGQSSATGLPVHPYTWYNYAGPGTVTYPVTLVALTAQGCSDTAAVQITVDPAVTAGFVPPGGGCAPYAATFANVSTGASSYLWTFGDGQASTEPSPTHLYLNQGVADVTFAPMLVATSSFGCTDTAFASINVHAQPIAQFIPGVLAGCQPLEVPFADLSIGASTLNWQFGDGTNLSAGSGPVTHTYVHGEATPQVFQASLIATSVNGCTDTTQSNIEVYPAIEAAYALDPMGCSPLIVQPVDQSTGVSSYLWDMGDGTILVGNAPSHTYVNGSTAIQSFTITLTATSPYGCVDVASQVVQVHPVPTAAFQATPFFQQFPQSTVDIVNNSTSGDWAHTWSFGDGSTSASQAPGSHTYGTWGEFTITLVVSGALCSDTVQQTVTIGPPLPTASFLGQAEGCAPLTVAFTNTSLLAQGFQWQFGDGGTSTADNPVYTYNVPGVYSVTLTATGPGGGTNTMVKIDSVIVRPRANAFFVLQPEEVVVPSQPVVTYNLSTEASSYFWDFGDGTTSTAFDPAHYYTEQGTYSVMLIANNAWNCPDTFLLANAVTGVASGELTFPNAFTPGNTGPSDGTYDPRSFDNDVFFPLFSGVEAYRLEVFNRWGELLFVSDDVRKGWDGYYRGQPAKQDVYVWKAFARFSDGRETVLKGDVTLLR